MRETDVTVTTVKHTTSVRLPVGVMVDMACVAAEGLSMLWCPPSDSKSESSITPLVERSRTEMVVERRVSLVAPVEGVFLRQWGSEGSEEGKFNAPGGICVSGEELFICDWKNHRIRCLLVMAALSASGAQKAAGRGSLRSPLSLR